MPAIIAQVANGLSAGNAIVLARIRGPSRKSIGNPKAIVTFAAGLMLDSIADDVDSEFVQSANASVNNIFLNRIGRFFRCLFLQWRSQCNYRYRNHSFLSGYSAPPCQGECNRLGLRTAKCDQGLSIGPCNFTPIGTSKNARNSGQRKIGLDYFQGSLQCKLIKLTAAAFLSFLDGLFPFWRLHCF